MPPFLRTPAGIQRRRGKRLMYQWKNFLREVTVRIYSLYPTLSHPDSRYFNGHAVKVLVSGGRKFADVKLMDRALDALHRRRRVQVLMTGALTGAQEMAYYWATRNRIPTIVTVPMQPDLAGKLDWSRWNHEVLKRFELDGLVVFPGRAETDHLAELAESHGLRVWRVPPNWRG